MQKKRILACVVLIACSLIILMVNKHKSDAPYTIIASTTNGEKAELNLRKKPVLFIATWCPHCREVLPVVAKMKPSERPDLVVTFLGGSDDTTAAQKELTKAGMPGANFFLMSNPPMGIKSVPCLVRYVDGKIQMQSGNKAVNETLRKEKMNVAKVFSF